MNAFQLVMWACAGVVVIMSGGLLLLVGVLAFIGKLAWELLLKSKEVKKKK